MPYRAGSEYREASHHVGSGETALQEGHMKPRDKGFYLLIHKTYLSWHDVDTLMFGLC